MSRRSWVSLATAVVLLAVLSPSAPGAPPTKGRFRPDPDLPEDAGVPYVIVTGEELAPAFQRLADWKRRAGMPAQVVTVEWLAKSPYYPGVDLPERLYRLIQDLRLNWRTRWVLLGGGVDVVPAQRIRAWRGVHGGNQIASDVFYADVLPEVRDDPDLLGAYGWNGDGDRYVGEAEKDGFDLVPDVLVGRVPATTLEEAEAFVDKWLVYSEARHKDAAWASRALVVGAKQFERPQEQVAKLFRDLGGSGYSAELVVERKPDAIQAISDELNRGYGFLDYFCHGCPAHFWACDDHTSWGVNQVRVLKNEGRYPIVFANSCNTDEFEKEVCLGSLMVLQPKAGAVAYVGYSNVSFGSDVDQAMYRALFRGDVPELGRALAEAKRSVAADTWVQQVLQLMGDPETWVRTAAPFAPRLGDVRLALDVPGRVTVLDAAGKPVRHARVVVEGPGVHLAGLTDETGTARLPAPAKAGSVRIAVLAQNGLPFERKANVESKPPAGLAAVARPTLSLDDRTDERTGEEEAPERLHGNGLGDLNPGETVRLVFAWPRSPPPADAALALAFEDDPFVASVAGPERTPEGVAFRVHASRRTPAWHQAWPTLAVRAGDETWTWTWRQAVEGPSLTCVSVAVDDAEGNRDRRIGWEDAGRKVRFALGLYNGGTQEARGVRVVATTEDPSVTLVRGTVAAGTVGLEDVVQAKDKPFEIQLAADYDGHAIAFRLAMEDDRRNRWDGRLVFTVPPAPPILPVAEPGVRSVSLSWSPGGSEGVVGYHVYRSTTEKGPWVRLTERPLRGSLRYPDATVKPASEYVYAISSVTADGLESRLSAPIRATTLSRLPRTREEKK